MKRILCIIGMVFGIALIWCCGFLTGRITAPEPPPKIVYVRQKTPAAKKSKPQRQIFTSPRGKKYYLTPSGNRAYIKNDKAGV